MLPKQEANQQPYKAVPSCVMLNPFLQCPTCNFAAFCASAESQSACLHGCSTLPKALPFLAVASPNIPPQQEASQQAHKACANGAGNDLPPCCLIRVLEWLLEPLLHGHKGN